MNEWNSCYYYSSLRKYLNIMQNDLRFFKFKYLHSDANSTATRMDIWMVFDRSNVIKVA